MKIHKVIQRSKEWHEIRHAKIGGTSAKRLFSDLDELAVDIAASLVEGYEDEDDAYVNAAMQRGIDLEPMAVASVEQYFGVKFSEFGWVESEECALLGLSPDGLTDDFETACEVKCPNAKTHLSYILANQVPLEYVNQVIHYFTVNSKLKRLIFASYRPEFKLKPIFVKEVFRDSQINIGTKAKPKMAQVGLVADLGLEHGKNLQIKVNKIIESLSF